ncbi:hypothetical protein STEG23_004231 [Scotinomys teguina]
MRFRQQTWSKSDVPHKEEAIGGHRVRDSTAPSGGYCQDSCKDGGRRQGCEDPWAGRGKVEDEVSDPWMERHLLKQILDHMHIHTHSEKSLHEKKMSMYSFLVCPEKLASQTQ